MNLPLRPLAACSAILTAATTARAEEKSPLTKPDDWSLHFQATTVSQLHDRFASPYAGQNSFRPDESLHNSVTATLFLGARLWSGAEFYVNPETAGGRGFSGTLGAAGFPNGEITRVGKEEMTGYFARYFLRQTFPLGNGATETIAAGPNQLPGKRDPSNLTVTLGKFSAADLFDQNAYSHDPRTRFLNWSLMGNGAWDYPADTRGYTYGVALEWNQPTWSARLGSFAEPTTANGAHFDHHLARALGNVAEIERSYSLGNHPGKIRALGFVNLAHMGDYRVTLNTPAYGMDLAQSRANRIKYGVGLNVEQELTRDLGAFARVGWNDGATETWAFTEIDRTAALGLSLKGTSWGRAGDHVGLAGVVNGLSNSHRDYLAAGGYGFIIGDGRLRYGEEMILETYYSLRVVSWAFVTLDYQWINHPAYNRDRGPASIGSLRLHAEF